jgi:hypothetical protein
MPASAYSAESFARGCRQKPSKCDR